MSHKSWPIIPRLSTSSKCVEINLSFWVHHPSMLRDIHVYIFEICKQISQSNINFEENIFVLTVLSYRKIPTGREEVFTLRVFSFLWANIHQRLISLFINFLSGIAVTLALIRSPESDFGWLGRPAVQIYISSFVAEFFVSYQDFEKDSSIEKKNSHLWWKNAQASVMNIKVVSKWKRHLTWDSDSDWGCKMSCQKTALKETIDPDTFKFYERLTSLLFKISPSS